MSTFGGGAVALLYCQLCGNDRGDFVNSFISVTPTLTSPVLVFITGRGPLYKIAAI